MTGSDAAVPDPSRAGKRLGLFLLALAIGFNAFFLAPELRIGRAPLNDMVFHRAASERLEASLVSGEPFLDPWVSEWALGYPVWRTYQPLSHLLGALVLRVGRPFAGPDALFAGLLTVLLVTLPASLYVGARQMGLSPPASGLASLLLFASSSGGDLDRYGLSYGSVTWRGSGLFSEVVALHVLVLAIGAVARALDVRARRPGAALLLGLTLLAHIIFGYVAFVSGAILAAVGPPGKRSERLVRLGTLVVPALVVAAWFLVPLFLARPIINHSRWEGAWKWDSYGAPFVLAELFSGRLMDFGRPPFLTGLVLLGALGALLTRHVPASRRLLALSAFWLAIFFGRETWGHLLLLVGVPGDLHLHRMQGAFQLCAVLLAGHGLASLLPLLRRRRHAFGLVGGVFLAAALVAIGADRARYLEQNAEWGNANLEAWNAEKSDLEGALGDVRAILAEQPGRASAGPAATWGGTFKVGAAPVYSFLSREHIDETSFLYHAMSKTSDLMVLRDEKNPAHDVVFGIRAVLAPSDRAMPPHLRRRSVHGRFAVYESSPEGYFGLVDLRGHYTGPPSTTFEPSQTWLSSPQLLQGIVLSLDPLGGGPAVDRWQPLPLPEPGQTRPRGRIVTETKTGETYRARVAMDRKAHVLVKVTWSPDLAATVDGKAARLVPVTPGFGAVAVPAGEHEVAVTYRPGRLKPVLFLLGVVLFGLSAHLLRSPAAGRAEGGLAALLAAKGARWATPRAAATAAIVGLAVVALHPLLRGRLVSGHDATEYPPRLVEMQRVLSEGHVPPVWAPDLGAGHGQPLFEFAPPLVYFAALPFRAAGAGLADALQLGLALLFAVGAAAVYRLGRRLGGSRPAAVGTAAAWLFAPYLALDLFVRAAFAEASAVAIAPLALLGLIRAMDHGDRRHLVLGAAAMALVPLTHNAAALLLFPAFALIALFFAGAAEDSGTAPIRLASAASGAGVLAAGLALSAWFWLPALLEKSFVATDRLREGFLHWSEHAATAWQLLFSPWGYGFSVPGPADGMSFAVGPVHLLVAGAGLVLAVRSKERGRKALAIAFALVAAAGAWLATGWSSLVWAHVEVLQYLAYPWRALLLPGLFLPLLAVFAFERAGPRRAAVLAGILVLFNLPHSEPKGYLTFDDAYYAAGSIASKGINTTTREEYEPRWVEKRPPYEPRALVALAGSIETSPVSLRAARQEVVVRATAPTPVESTTFFYPGWTVTIDGTEVPASPVPVRGTMRFDVPAGESRVVIQLRPTPLRNSSLLASIATAFLLGAGARFLRTRSRSRS